MQPDEDILDDNLVANIYNSCMIAHTWYCQTFYNGYFYLCSRPIFADQYYKKLGRTIDDLKIMDGISLHEDNLRERIINYLNSEKPLRSCKYCLGTVGKKIKWEQLNSTLIKQPELSTKKDAIKISNYRLAYLLIWRYIESSMLKIFPSRHLSTFMGKIQTWTIGD